jgi:hypothetical protein
MFMVRLKSFCPNSYVTCYLHFLCQKFCTNKIRKIQRFLFENDDILGKKVEAKIHTFLFLDYNFFSDLEPILRDKFCIKKLNVVLDFTMLCFFIKNVTNRYILIKKK